MNIKNGYHAEFWCFQVSEVPSNPQLTLGILYKIPLKCDAFFPLQKLVRSDFLRYTYFYAFLRNWKKWSRLYSSKVSSKDFCLNKIWKTFEIQPKKALVFGFYVPIKTIFRERARKRLHLRKYSCMYIVHPFARFHIFTIVKGLRQTLYPPKIQLSSICKVYYY